MSKIHYRSETNEWETPNDLYQELDKEFHFTLDPCCTIKNCKCSKGFAIDNGFDGLKESWKGETVFMNPPYGREVGKWIEKAYNESNYTKIVCLVFSKTDTIWWHEYVMKATEIRYIKGRLSFKRSDGFIGRASFPSAIVIFGK